MKRRNILVISIVSISVLLIITIASGILGFTHYKYEFSKSISSTWNNSKSLFNRSNEENFYPPVPIVVVYKTKKVGDITAQNPLIIDISEKDFGPLWFPIVHKSDYHFTVTCNNALTINSASAFGQYTVDGVIHVSGHYKLIGIYSRKTVTNLVVDEVLKSIYDDCKKNIK